MAFPKSQRRSARQGTSGPRSEKRGKIQEHDAQDQGWRLRDHIEGPRRSGGGVDDDNWRHRDPIRPCAMLGDMGSSESPSGGILAQKLNPPFPRY